MKKGPLRLDRHNGHRSSLTLSTWGTKGRIGLLGAWERVPVDLRSTLLGSGARKPISGAQ